MEIKIERLIIQNWRERSRANPDSVLYVFCRKTGIRKDGTLSGWCETFCADEVECYDYEIARFRAGELIQEQP